MKERYPVLDVKATGQNLKSIMQAKEIAVKDVQQYLGLSTPQAVYHWFSGKSMPTLDHLYALSELFCMPVDQLLRGNRKYMFMPLREAMRSRLTVYYEHGLQLRAG